MFYKSSKLQPAIPDKNGSTVLIFSVIGWGLPLVVNMAIFSIDFIVRREFLYDTDRCIYILDEPAFGVNNFINIGLQNINFIM